MSKFFSGFCLKNEKVIFQEYIKEGEYNLSGFSYGAIKAFEYALNTNERVELLQLFSPAFFQTQDKKYKRMQELFFKKDAITYCDNFLANVASPSDVDIIAYFKMGKSKELQELLNYEWNEESISTLLNKGTKIEVYLGSEDKIIDSEKAKEFFSKYSTTYYIKGRGHTL